MASSGITTVDQKNKKAVEVFDTEEELAVSLAKYTADLSDKFAKERGSFTVVVSGGSLIKSLRYLSLQSSLIKSAKLIFFLFIIGFMMMGFVGLSFFVLGFRKLVEAPYVDSIDWSKWHVFWVDERVVPKDHPDSNYKLAFDGFLSKVHLSLLVL
jgi:6-phosphogluconolactonase